MPRVYGEGSENMNATTKKWMHYESDELKPAPRAVVHKQTQAYRCGPTVAQREEAAKKQEMQRIIRAVNAKSTR